ncbi:MAG: hypothetical protein FGM27_00720 [Candidatus Omnitrophica bacterium]|nr:hypothetical protein [Candidatus Omnitrophota bacterium]
MFGKFKSMADQLKMAHKLMKDENFRNLMAHPKMQELMKDPEFQRLAREQNFARLTAYPKFAALLRDPELRDALQAFVKSQQGLS